MSAPSSSSTGGLSLGVFQHKIVRHLVKPLMALLGDDDDDGSGRGGDGGGDGGGGDDDDEPFSWDWKYKLSSRTKKQVACLALGVLGTTLATDVPFSPLHAPEEDWVETLAVLIGGYIRGSLIMFAAYLLHPNLAYNARRWARVDTSEAGDSINYVATLLGLVYAILVGSTYDDANNKQDLIQQSLYREVSNLHQVVMLGKELNGGHDRKTTEELYRMVQQYVQCTRENDFKPDADVCSKCAYLLSDMTSSVTRLSADGSHDKLDRTITGGVISALRSAQTARADRLAGMGLSIPTTHLVRMRIGGTALVTAFLLITSGSPKFDAAMFGGLTGTYVVLDSTLRDMGTWNKTWGDWQVDDGALEALSDEIDLLLEGKVLKPDDAEEAPKPEKKPAKEDAKAEAKGKQADKREEKEAPKAAAKPAKKAPAKGKGKGGAKAKSTPDADKKD